MGRLAPALAWMAVIYWFSDQPDIPHASLGWLDFLIKKALHALAYGILAGLWLRVLAPKRPISSRAAAIVLAICLLWALSDEWHQTLVPGRTGRARDVVIDALGAGTAVALARRAPRSRVTPRPAVPF